MKVAMGGAAQGGAAQAGAAQGATALRGALGATFVLLTLTGCVAGTPAPTPSATASTTPSPTARPPQTPSATPEPVTEDPADTSTWLVSGGGIGRIAIGTAASDLDLSASGFVTDVVDEGCTIFDSPGVWSVTAVGAPIQAVGIARYDSTSPVTGSPQTAEGIRLGSPEELVIAAYPDVPLIDDGIRFPHYAVPAGDRFIVVMVDAGEVRGMLITDRLDYPLHLC